ncbi:hypothetical protein AsAng_0003630 [Aureispira anguillae]|uniref:Uncharacterized protein n=1 Tax=Aureispira anguillae TaxID=2864201 RepID=A0A915Y9Z0_9BACT|nr:hypothetical protein AsAng_0003630 [Aureispira anguillae]
MLRYNFLYSIKIIGALFDWSINQVDTLCFDDQLKLGISKK